jgi:hypothetical protein
LPKWVILNDAGPQLLQIALLVGLRGGELTMAREGLDDPQIMAIS